jgi:hypothetical protein
MANKHRYTPKQVADAIVQSKGMLYLTAKRLGCSYQTVLNYCTRFKMVEDVRKAQRGEMLDTAEMKLWRAIQKGEPWGIAFCLKTIGKDRGYVERQEVGGEGGQPLVLRVVYENAPVLDTPLEPRQLDAGTNGFEIVYEDEPKKLT